MGKGVLKGAMFPLATQGSLSVGVSHPVARNSEGLVTQRIMAMATGEKRPPKKGEYYLSGAIIEAYQAWNDLSDSFHIAKLVVVERVPEIWKYVRDIEPKEKPR